MIKISFCDERAALFPVAQSQHHRWSCRLIWLQWTPRARSGIIRLPVMKWVRCYCQLPGRYEVQVCALDLNLVCALVNTFVNLVMYQMCIVKYVILLEIHDYQTWQQYFLRNFILPSSSGLTPSLSLCNNLGLIAFTCWSKSHLGNSIHLMN